MSDGSLTVRKLTVPRAVIEAMPPEKQSALLFLGLFLNDANLLRKLLVQAVHGNADDPDGQANFALTAMLATTLAGKIHEGWLRMGENDLCAVLNSLPMSAELKTLRAEIETRLASKVFLRLRNNPGFHYPNRKLQFAKLKPHIEDADLHLYVTEAGYAGDVLSHLSTLAGIEPIMAIDGSGDYRVALEQVWNEVTEIAGKYCAFVSEAQASLLVDVVPASGPPTETLMVPDPPEIASHPLRFFMRPPADLEAMRALEVQPTDT